MADKAQNNELDEFAFEIYKQSVASSANTRGGEQQARASYVKAEAFIAVRDKFRNGELKSVKVDGPRLVECCAPNRPRTDPFNLISERFGDMTKVSQVKKWLDANPTPESDQMDIVHRFKTQFPEYQWGVKDEDVFASINTARIIFPAFAKN
jgi:hypothetical protein